MAMNPKVYLETTIPSYLTAWPKRDLVQAAHQQVTREWWEQRRTQFDLFVSQIVILECRSGDPVAANKRLDSLEGIPLLEETADTLTLAENLVARIPLPSKVAADALHIAIAAAHGMDYLLTWNCAHIANASLQHKIREVCQSFGYNTPVICTPEQLMQEENSP